MSRAKFKSRATDLDILGVFGYSSDIIDPLPERYCDKIFMGYVAFPESSTFQYSFNVLRHYSSLGVEMVETQHRIFDNGPVTSFRTPERRKRMKSKLRKKERSVK